MTSFTLIKEPELPEALALTRTAFFSPDGQTAIMRVIVGESNEWGELTIDHDREEGEEGPPTWHTLWHELGDDSLGELIADGEDVWEFCLREGLAPGQRAWVWLQIWYVGGHHDPTDIDREVDAEIMSIEPMDPDTAAERWEAFLWRRDHLGLDHSPEVAKLIERAKRDIVTFATEILELELTEAQKAYLRGAQRREPTGEDLLAAIRNVHATSPQGAEGQAGNLVERVNRQVAAEDRLRDMLGRVLTEDELERFYHLLRDMFTDRSERWNEDGGVFG